MTKTCQSNCAWSSWSACNEPQQLRDSAVIQKIGFVNEDCAAPGDDLLVLVEIDNTGGRSLAGLKVDALAAQLGVKTAGQSIDINQGGKKTVLLHLEIPKNTKEGYYDLMVRVTDGSNINLVKYRDFKIRLDRCGYKN